jgi:hypothetical protein
MQFRGKGNPMPMLSRDSRETRYKKKLGGFIKAVWHEKDGTECLILVDFGNMTIFNESGHSRFVRNENSNSPYLLDTQS